MISINNALKDAKFNYHYPILLKIDIEGLEKDVIKKIDFVNNPDIKELIVEGTGNKESINKKIIPQVRNGYVEIYRF